MTFKQPRSTFASFKARWIRFSMQLLDQGHHPYISTGFGGKHFYSLVSDLFVVCKLHTCSRLSLIKVLLLSWPQQLAVHMQH